MITSIKVNKSSNKFVLGGEAIYKYTDEEFMEKVKDKIGNVRAFKKHLREKGLIGNRQQFSEEHIQIFNEIKQHKLTNHTTWEMAFKMCLAKIQNNNSEDISLGIAIAESTPNNLEDILKEILVTLKRIDSKL
jgi:hypothetical protein